MSIKRTLLGQVVGSIVIACCWFVWAILFEPQALAPIFLSALVGGACVFLPATCYARLVTRMRTSLLILILGEIGKVLLTIALFMLFLRFYSPIRWLPLLTTYVVVLQIYWLALVQK